MRWRRLCSKRWTMLGMMAALIGLRVLLHWLLAPETLPEHAYFGIDLERYTRQYLAAAHPPSEADRQVLAQLAQPVTLQFKDAALHDALNDLAAAAHVRIEADWESLDKLSIDEGSSVTITTTQIPVGAALALIMDRLYVGRVMEMPVWTVQDGNVIVKRRDNEQRRIVTRVYDIRDLVGQLANKHSKWELPLEYIENELVDAISANIIPNLWLVKAPLTTVNGRLTVRARGSMQQHVEAFLDALRAIMERRDIAQSVLGNAPAWHRAWRKLGGHLEMEDDHVLVGTVIDGLRQQLGVQVWVDWNSTWRTQATVELNVLPDQPGASPSGIGALDAVAHYTRFDEWAIADEGHVMVSAAESLPLGPAVRLYDIRRIIDQAVDYYESHDPGDDDGPSLLRDLMYRLRFGQGMVGMSIFDDADDPTPTYDIIRGVQDCIILNIGVEHGSPAPSVHNIGGVLVVRAARRTHERITELLRQLDDAGGD